MSQAGYCTLPIFRSNIYLYVERNGKLTNLLIQPVSHKYACQIWELSARSNDHAIRAFQEKLKDDGAYLP